MTGQRGDRERWVRVLVWLVLSGLILLAAGVLWASARLQASLARLDGEAVVRSLQQPVESRGTTRMSRPCMLGAS